MNYYIFTTYIDKEGQKVPVSKFTIEIPKLIHQYDREIGIYRKTAKNLPSDAPRHTEYRRIVAIRELLLDAVQQNVDHEFSNNAYVEVFSGLMIVNREYNKVYCIECGKDYLPEDITVKKWTHGKGLAASGGSTLYCPEGHLLHGILEWIS